MEWGMDMVLRRNPAGRVSKEPGIIPKPWPSLGLKRLRHEGDLRKDLSSHCGKRMTLQLLGSDIDINLASNSKLEVENEYNRAKTQKMIFSL